MVDYKKVSNKKAALQNGFYSKSLKSAKNATYHAHIRIYHF
jgi:hypothetical protein